MMILSMDLGKFNTVCCFYDTANHKYRFETIQTKRNHVEHIFGLEKVDLVVMEACGPSGWISDICHEKNLRTIVCSTNDEAWCWKNTKRKTDRDDALKLAKMAMMDALTSVHVPKPEIREQRAIIKYRKGLDQRINRIKNAIRSLFANHGIEIDTGKRAWCLGRLRIDGYRKPIADCAADELWKGQLDLELMQLDDLTEKMKAVEDRLEQFAKANPNIQRVMTIPGVGRKTAEALVAAIDDRSAIQQIPDPTLQGMMRRRRQIGPAESSQGVDTSNSRVVPNRTANQIVSERLSPSRPMNTPQRNERTFDVRKLSRKRPVATGQTKDFIVGQDHPVRGVEPPLPKRHSRTRRASVGSPHSW